MRWQRPVHVLAIKCALRSATCATTRFTETATGGGSRRKTRLTSSSLPPGFGGPPTET